MQCTIHAGSLQIRYFQVCQVKVGFVVSVGLWRYALRSTWSSQNEQAKHLLLMSLLTIDEIGNITCINSSFCKEPNQLTYPYSTDSIAWPADADRFQDTQWRNVAGFEKKIVPPPFWRTAFPQYKDGYNAKNLPNLHTDTRLQVNLTYAGYQF
jgi:hypothetical protein